MLTPQAPNFSPRAFGSGMVIPSSREDVSNLGTNDGGAASGGPPQPVATGITQRMTSAGGSNPNGSEVKPSVNAEWRKRWKDDDRTIRTLNEGGKAPSNSVNGQACTVCLGYNLMGRCFKLCSKATSHFTSSHRMPSVELEVQELVDSFSQGNATAYHNNQYQE